MTTPLSPLKVAFRKTFPVGRGLAHRLSRCPRRSARSPGSTGWANCSIALKRWRKSWGYREAQAGSGKCGRGFKVGKDSGLVVMEIIDHETDQTRIFPVPHHR